MENYDVIIIGAGTSGSYFGSKLAEKGFKVLIIDKLSEEKSVQNMISFIL